MDEKQLEQSLAEELIQEWSITPTGSGFLIATDWHWPNGEHIEVYVRTVGEREDLYLVSDGGELFNFLFSQGVDLTRDPGGMKVIEDVAQNNGARIVDYQMVKGATEGDAPRAIRMILEAIKDASFILWHKLGPSGPVH